MQAAAKLPIEPPPADGKALVILFTIVFEVFIKFKILKGVYPDPRTLRLYTEHTSLACSLGPWGYNMGLRTVQER